MKAPAAEAGRKEKTEVARRRCRPSDHHTASKNNRKRRVKVIKCPVRSFNVSERKKIAAAAAAIIKK
jgi:hypothetical protein